jgi:hypothetical protein
MPKSRRFRGGATTCGRTSRSSKGHERRRLLNV